MADGTTLPDVTAEARRQRELAVLAWLQKEHPDIWALSQEVDWSLIEFMLGLTPSERLDTCQQAARNMEVYRGASKIS
jgi:hypothetical protein